MASLFLEVVVFCCFVAPLVVATARGVRASRRRRERFRRLHRDLDIARLERDLDDRGVF